MALPDVVCRIGFASPPLASGAWVLGYSGLGINTRLGLYDAVAWDDVSGDVREILIVRGRQYELGQIQAGTCTVTLNNLSGDYWPNNAGGAYYPNVIPDRRINIRAIWDGVTYDRYTGYIESWVPGYMQDGSSLAPIVTITATGFYEIAARSLLDDAVGYAQELSGTRVANILDDVGFPLAARDIDAGQTTMIATGALDGSNALQQLQLVQDSELGTIFQRGDGYIVFQDRQARQTDPLRNARAMFGEGTDLDVGPAAIDRASAL